MARPISDFIIPRKGEKVFRIQVVTPKGIKIKHGKYLYIKNNEGLMASWSGGPNGVTYYDFFPGVYTS